jgi:hypothetical protein
VRIEFLEGKPEKEAEPEQQQEMGKRRVRHHGDRSPSAIVPRSGWNTILLDETAVTRATPC